MRFINRLNLNRQGCSVNLAIISFLLFFIPTVQPTVDLGLQVMAVSQCNIGTVYQPNSCTRCVCGILNLMLCRQVCNPSQDTEVTPKPSGNRPTGPTIVPILIPTLNRRPSIQFSNFTLLNLLRPVP